MFFLVPAYPGCPGQTAVKWLVVVGVFVLCYQMKQQLHYAWYRMHTADVSDKTKCISRESHYSVSLITYSVVNVISFVTLLLHIFVFMGTSVP